MKRVVMVFAIFAIISTSAQQDILARAIGFKAGYATMQNDFEDAGRDDTWAFGVFFDMGKFLFDSLRFKPLVDYTPIEHENGTELVDIWSFHLDWYWYFMGSSRSQIAPFIGFGPSLNYLDDQTQPSYDDSDAGVDLFAGMQFGLSGDLALLAEIRYRFIDIAERNENILQYSLGLQVNF